MRCGVFEQAASEARTARKEIDAEIDRLQAHRELLEVLETVVRQVLAFVSVSTVAVPAARAAHAATGPDPSLAERASGPAPPAAAGQFSLTSLLSESNALSRRLAEMLEGDRRELQVLATHDSLTGLFNRAAILEHLDREISRAVRNAEPLGVMLADLDHFKSVNDQHGHLCGDEVLREAASRFRAAIRSYDVAGRYGGEEFLILFPGWNPDHGAGRIDQVLDAIRSQPFPVKSGDAELRLTCSAGVAVFLPGHDEPSVSELLSRADSALYVAKSSGRNTARIETRLP